MSEDEEEGPGERQGLTPEQERAAEDVYGLVGGLIEADGTVSKEELVKAYGGDYKVDHMSRIVHSTEMAIMDWWLTRRWQVFEKMDVDGSKSVTWEAPLALSLTQLLSCTRAGRNSSRG